MNEKGRKLAWLGVSAAAAIAGHQLARRSLNAGWETVTGSPAPNEGEIEGDLKAALLWAAASGTLVAVARILGQRGAELGWKRVTGESPPAGKAVFT